MITNLALAISLLFFSSCSHLIELIDNDLLEKEAIPYKKVTLKPYCPNNKNIQIFSQSQESQNSFKNFIESQKFTFIEKVIIFIFVQMNLNPDISTPYSNLQIVLNDQDYLSFTQSLGEASIFDSMSTLLKRKPSNYSLRELARIYDKNYPSNFIVSKRLAHYLSNNKLSISSNKQLKKLYIRGDETLREKERIFKQGIAKLIKRKNTYKYKPKKLFSNQSVTCNFDIQKYKDSRFEIMKKELTSNIFGIKYGKDSALIVTSNNYGTIKSLSDTIYFKNQTTKAEASICMSKTRENTLWLISSNSRDPSQILSNLITRNIFQAKTKDKVHSILNTPRLLRLKNPSRLIFESERSSRRELEVLHSFNTPIYSQYSLGIVSAYFEGKKASSFINDNRSSASLTCR